MKKSFLFILIIMFMFIGTASSSTMSYDFKILNNKAYNLTTGVIYDNENYVSTNRIYLKARNINFTDNVYHHILLWDKYNKFLGYLNSNGSILKTDKFIDIPVTNTLNFENNGNLLDHVNSIAFMSYKSLNKEFNFNFNNYSYNTNFNPSRNQYENSNLFINETINSFKELDLQVLNYDTKYLQSFKSSGELTGGKLYFTNNKDRLEESTYYVSDIYKNNLFKNNNQLEFTKIVDREINTINRVDIAKCYYVVNENLKNSCNFSNSTINYVVNEKIFNGGTSEIWKYEWEVQDSIMFSTSISDKLIGYENVNSNLLKYQYNILGQWYVGEGIVGSNTNTDVRIRINKTRLNNYNDNLTATEKINLLKQYFSQNNLIISYQVTNSSNNYNSNLFKLKNSYNINSLQDYENKLRFDNGYIYYIPVNPFMYYPLVKTVDDIDFITWDSYTNMNDEYYIFSMNNPSYVLQEIYGKDYSNLDFNNIGSFDFTDLGTNELERADLYHYDNINDILYMSYDKITLDNYGLSPDLAFTKELYNLQLGFYNYIIGNIPIYDTYEIDLTKNNQFILSDNIRPLFLVGIADYNKSLIISNLNLKSQLEVGNKFTFYRPFNYNYNNTVLPVDLPDAIINEIEFSLNYNTQLSENSFNLLQVNFTHNILDPLEKLPVEDKIDNWLVENEMESPFLKIILSVSILIGVTILLFILKLSRIVILMIDSLGFILLIFLGWLPIWLLMLLAMLIFGYFMINMRSDGNIEQ